MRYQKSYQLKKSSEDTIKWFITTLSQQGYKIVEKTKSSCRFEGPGLTSTRQNPLLGATKIFVYTDNKLNLDCSLGGVRWMNKFFIWFPISLNLLLLIIFSFTIGVTLKLLLIMLGTIAPWPIFIPLINKGLVRRTERAIEVIANNSQF